MGGSLTRKALLSMLVVLSACALSPASGDAFVRRVPDTFFGISAPSLYKMVQFSEFDELDRDASQIKAAGIDWVRGGVGWSDAEPSPPVGGTHTYNWNHADGYIGALAEHGLTALPELLAPPAWAASGAATAADCGRKSAVAAGHVSDYGAFAGAFMRRYGRNGQFWLAHPELPYQPVTRVELWNEPNWAAWCPAPDPQVFAQLLKSAGNAIHAVDSAAAVVVGGLVVLRDESDVPPGSVGMPSAEFLAQMVTAVPTLASAIDAVGIHLYESDPDVDLSLLGWLKARMRAVGLGNESLMVTEFGWHTRGGAGSLAEPLRAVGYATLAHQFPRTDCGLLGIAAHNWESEELNVLDPEHWYGIADPITGLLHPTGTAYKAEIALYEGRGPVAAPRRTIPVCGGSLPDQDGDGAPDERDHYPLDPARQTGSGESSPEDNPTSPPRVAPPRVPDSFFGVSLPSLPIDPWDQRPHYEALRDARIPVVRDKVAWSAIEPVAPSDPDHRLQWWSELDPRFLQLGLRGIRLLPSFGSPPGWAQSVSGGVDAAYGDFLGKFARRYGAGGSFWQENRHLDPGLAPRDYEIWSGANSNVGAPDGSASASEYASMYARARAALRSVDEHARAVASLGAGGEAGDAASFLRGMVVARPGLRGAIDAVYVEATAARSVSGVESVIPKVRAALEDTGNGGAPIYVGFGAPTRGTGSLTESARADFYAQVASRLARSDCGVDGAFPMAWMSAQLNPTNPWDWFGIADPVTASLSATGQAYRDTAGLMRGYQPGAPRAVVHSCFEQAPDRDGDGTPDAAESYPLDPSRSQAEESAPAAPAIDGPAAWTSSRLAAFTYSAPGATSYWCELDGQELEVCPMGGRAYSNMLVGEHEFTVRALSPQGLVGPPSQYRWTVDQTPPRTTITSGPDGLLLTDEATFAFTADEVGATFVCRLDDASWEACTSPRTYRGLADGLHSFRVIAADRAGNTQAVPQLRTFDVRATPTAPRIDEGPGEGATTGARPMFAFHGNFTTRFECRFDAEPFERCSGDATHRPEEDLAEGAHTFEVRGVGGGGKRGPATSRGFEVDATPPRVRILMVGQKTSGRTARFRFDVSDASALSRPFACRLDGKRWEPCESPWEVRRLRADRRHVLRVRVEDRPGNRTVKKVRWRVT
jgi:hypothetical protein